MRALADAERLRAFMRDLGTAAHGEATVYLTGGATAVLLGWRVSTLDADIKLVPDRDELLRAIQRLKVEHRLNVELASPDEFLPPLPGWEERSAFAAKEGPLVFRHYDYYAQVLSKLERRHVQDLDDAGRMLQEGLVLPNRLLELYGAIEPFLYKYPAVDPRALRRNVEAFCRPA